MKLIDADKLFDAMEETEWYNNADRDEIAERLIMDAPSIDIVRCRDCKYCGKDRIKWSEKDDDGNWIDTKCNCCYALSDTKLKIKEVNLDDYCSWGERSRR